MFIMLRWWPYWQCMWFERELVMIITSIYVVAFHASWCMDFHLVLCHWIERRDQWQVINYKGGSVAFMFQRGTIHEWTKSVIYLWCPHWYHLHIKLRIWCIACIPALWLGHYCNWCIFVNDIHVIGDYFKYTILYCLCTTNSSECILTPWLFCLWYFVHS